jgi:putative DNA primase/helicase
MASLLSYALHYAAHGWPVFPLDGKRPHPVLGAKGGFKLATTDEQTIERWWTAHPDANIGVPCGEISGFFVIDVDPRNGGDQAWTALLDQYGHPEATTAFALVQQTGGGGQHYLFEWDSAVRKGKLGEGIDVKRDGGYIVVEPSVTTKAYAFDDWDLFAEPPPLRPAPAWLLRLLSVPVETPATGKTSEKWDADVGKLRSALALLDVEDYDEWVSVGAALYNASGGTALEEWIRWSKGGKNFEDGACEKRWPSFERYPDKRATLGSIYWKAMQAGWRPPRSRAPEPPMPESQGEGGNVPPDDGQGDAPADDPRPVIKWIDGELPRSVDEAEAALMRSAEGIYQRGQQLVRIVRRESTSVRNFKRRKPADVALREVDKPYLVEALTRAAVWARWDKRNEDWRFINCPATVADTYLSRSGRWRLPHLLAAITAPTLRPDGTVLQTPGYDPTTATWYDPCGFEYPEVPDQPTKADAQEALSYLHANFKSFPFQDDVDRSVAIALALTAIVRRALPSSPLGAITAPVMASGKTLLADLIAIMGSGVPAPAMQLPETEEEAKKVALSILMMGDPVVLIDNVERPLQGDWLCTALTSETFSGRMLGVSQMVHVPTCTLWLANGNQLTVAGDLRTRALLCRLDPQMERPEQREFKSDIRVAFTERRPKLVAAGLTIMRAFICSGEPPSAHVTPWGRFDAWSNMVRAPLVWLDEKDPYLSTQQLDNEDPYRLELAAMLSAWWSRFEDLDVRVSEVMSASEDKIDTRAGPLLEALRTVAGDRGGTVNARRLGHWLRRHAGRILEQRKFERGGDKNGSATWRVERVSPQG